MTNREHEAQLAWQLSVLVVAVLLAITAAATCVDGESLAPPASAQDATPPTEIDLRGQDMTPAVVLARVCWKEAPLPTSNENQPDCLFIGQTLLRVGGGNVVSGALRNSVRAFVPARLDNRPWIAFLNKQGDEPAMWPANMSWNVYRERWLALVEQARAILRDVSPDDPICIGKYTTKEPRRVFASRCLDPSEVDENIVCSPAMQWGGLMDHHRAHAFGWLTLECGPSHPFGRAARGNIAYARPSSVPARAAMGG